MLNAGFNHGSPVYLDLENGPPYPAKESVYVNAWADEVRALGFIPGIYASHLLTNMLPTGTLNWDFKIPTTARTFETLPAEYPPALPAGINIRQYRQNVVLRGTGILVDLNQAPDATGLAS
jgi:hypothetical protein